MASNSNSFDQNFRGLLNVCKNIFKKRSADRLDLQGKGDPIEKCLELYIRCYQRTEPHEREEFHQDLFKILFEENKQSILDNGHINTDWLKDRRSIIQYGENLGMDVKKVKIRIYLNVIFALALEYKQKAIRRYPDPNSDEYQNADEIDYPDKMILYLYKIFKSWPHEKQVTARLNIIISEIEERLGLTNDSGSSFGTGSGAGLDGVLQFATNMIGQMGISPSGSAGGPPKGEDIGKALQQVFGNPNTQKTIGNMFAGLNESNDIGEVIGKFVNGISDPKFKEAIGSSLSSFSDNIRQSSNGKSEDGLQIENTKRKNPTDESNHNDGQFQPNDEEEIPIYEE